MDQPQLRQRPQGFIINPRTGRPVGVDGRIGKQLERERIAALERERMLSQPDGPLQDRSRSLQGRRRSQSSSPTTSRERRG